MSQIKDNGTQNLTPMIQQYLQIKARYNDAILFFRMGDFYEMFFDDAKKASKILQIALTTRGKNIGEDIPLCGIPYHAIDSYLPKLLDKGIKVAICEQLEEPGQGKKIVRRDVVKVVSPGTVTDPAYLNPKSNNFMISLSFGKGVTGISVLDISTGEFSVTEFNGTDRLRLINEIIRIEPSEVLLPSANQKAFKEEITSSLLRPPFISPFEDWKFDYETARRALLSKFGVSSLEGFGCEGMSSAISSAGAMIQYLEETQKENLKHINRLRTINNGEYMVLDGTTIKNLEVLRSQADGSRENTILNIIDDTATAMGGRLLRQWLLKPLLDVDEISERYNSIDEFIERSQERRKVRDELSEIQDIDRLIGKLANGNAGPRDLAALRFSFERLPLVKKLMAPCESKLLHSLSLEVDAHEELTLYLKKALVDSPPLNIRDTGAIREGFNPELDELRNLKNNTKDFISSLEREERERSGISSLKVGFNRVFGYYIEVTKSNLNNVPADFIRKQTLTNGERFITPKLKEYEERILTAEEKIKEIEIRIFNELIANVSSHIRAIQKTAYAVAEIDVLSTLASVAEKNNYVRPVIDNSDRIDIKDGRHPVIERISFDERFVPNDTLLDCEANRLSIITGPNMAGKSTYMRQVALIVMMAQMGSFVPAREAHIGIVDRIFTRIGASDNLASGQSTFMLEMNETANIMNNATKRSLIILDEIGRGTSTFDGLSIAWAVAEFIHSKERLGARTLFATHYHELTELSAVLDGARNYNVAVKEWNDEIIFLRKIVEGGTDKSYGIHVAKLSGIPADVIKRAREILFNLENREFDRNGNLSLLGKSQTPNNNQQMLPIFDRNESEVLNEIRNMDINSITPLEALTKLGRIKEMLSDEEKKQ